ncbi:thioredoxin domain-containing protein [Candidatus Saccharibacteria bacterium]|nr:thioredoxin domain-containing protein [Candidatus Saccharibacteria bacterium]
MKKNKGFSKIGVIVGVVVVAFIAVMTVLVIDGNNRATNFSNYDFNSIIEADEHNGEIGDHVKGSADAPVLIFEYADFQCPGCSSMNPYVNQAVEEMDGKLAVVYRNYLLSYHPNATAASSAAEAAGMQGYWKPYADMLFAHQDEWEDANSSERAEIFSEYFEKVSDGKGDLEKFKEDIASENVSKKINFDMGIGKRVGVEGTPAFFVDGELIDWSTKGGSITINGKTFSWDSGLTAEGFVTLLKDITSAKLGEPTSMDK